MRTNTMKSSVVLAIAAGLALMNCREAKAIELLVIITQEMANKTVLAQGHIDRVADKYFEPIEEAHLDFDDEAVAKLLFQANWEIEVIVKSHDRQISNIARGAIPSAVIDPYREAEKQVVKVHADEAWFDLVEAAGGFGIGLDPGGKNPGKSPRW